ncbi:MAG: FtsX-like permease family protein [Candidatus Methylomirabilia bacterium]
MRTLTRKMIRDFWKIRWRALSIVLTVACGVGIFAGIEMAIESLFNTRDVLFDRMRFADLEVQFLPEDVANLPELTQVPGVQTVERRLILRGEILLGGGRRLAGVLVFLETPEPSINSLERLAGHGVLAEDFESSVIERSLARYHGLEVGDRIRVRVGARIYDSRVDGVARSPEYLVTTANPDYVIPEKGALGVVFANLARVSDSLGFTMVNDLLFRFEPGAEPGAVQQAVLERLGRLNLERVIPREEHFIWRFLQIDLEAFRIYTPSIILILGALAFILTLITVNRLVQDQRREIGGLLALGYRRGRVLRAYLGAGALLGGAGALLGMPLAFVFRNLFAEIYTGAMGVPEVVYVVEPDLLAIGFAAGLLITAVATALPVARMIRLTPQAIIREPVQGGLLSHAWIQSAFTWMGVLPTPVRFGIRNMFRRPWRSLSTVLAIAFSLGVSMAYMVAMTSMFETVGIVFEGERWDLAVDFLYPVFLEDLEPIRSLPGVVRVEPYFRRFAEAGAKGRYEGASILGIHPETGMKRTMIKEGRFLSGAPDELLLSQDLARRLEVGVGDRVTIRIRRGEEFAFRLVGISAEIILGQVMMPFRRTQVITNFKDEGTGAYIETAGAAADLPAALTRLDYVAKVTTKEGLVAAFQRLMTEMMGIVYMATGVSIFVAMLFIFTSVNLVITERRAEYATFKSLGYGRRRLRAVILTETLGQGSLAALLSIPVGIGLAVFLNARMSQAWYEVINIFRATDFVQVLAIAMALMPVSAYPGLRMIDRLNIAHAIRTRIIE